MLGPFLQQLWGPHSPMGGQDSRVLPDVLGGRGAHMHVQDLPSMVKLDLSSNPIPNNVRNKDTTNF